MTGEIHIEPVYLAHSGGTKFYEVVVLHNPDTKKFVLAKRWGKMSSVRGGGETMVEEHPTLRKAQAAAEKLISSKVARGYERASSTDGFHGMANSFRNWDVFNANLARHYESVHTRDQIRAGLGNGDAESVPAAVEDDEIVSEEPAPEPDRGDTWGSW